PPNGFASRGTSCDDNNPCTEGETCDGVGGCQPAAMVACTENRVCNATTCCGTTAANCDDNDACTENLCAGDGGACSFRFIPSPGCLDAGGPRDLSGPHDLGAPTDLPVPGDLGPTDLGVGDLAGADLGARDLGAN